MCVDQYRSFTTDIGEKVAMNGELNVGEQSGMNQATREGYELFGWTSANGTVWDPEWGTGLAYVDDNTLTHGQASYASYIMTLTAKWSPKGDTKAYEENTGSESYTITFDTNGGGTIAPISGSGNEPVKLPANPTKEGFSFFGWSTGQNVEAPISIDIDNNQETIPAPKGNLTLHALWSTTAYSIILDPGDGGMPISAVYAIPGSLVTSLPTPEKENAVFGGWEENGNLISLPFTMGTENKSLKARWLNKLEKPAAPTVNDEDITGVDADYVKLEQELQKTIEKTPRKDFWQNRPVPQASGNWNSSAVLFSLHGCRYPADVGLFLLLRSWIQFFLLSG